MKRYVALVVCAGVLPVLATCNVFSELDDCRSDSDCPAASLCRLDVGRCVPRSPEVPSEGGPPDASSDADADAAPPPPIDAGGCDPTMPFDAPTPVPGLAGRSVISARVSPDEKTMLVSFENGSPTDYEIATATRSKTTDPFAFGAVLPVVNSPHAEYWPTLSADGKVLFFESDRSRARNDAGVYEVGSSRIWTTSRSDVAFDFDEPRLQTLFDIDGTEAAPFLQAKGRSLYFASLARPGLGSLDLFVAEIDPSGIVGEVRNLATVNSATSDNAPVVSFDDRELYFARPDDLGNDSIRDVYVARRSTPADGFGKSERVPALSSNYDELPSWVSPDGCRVYLVSDRPLPGTTAIDGYHAWFASRAR